MANCNKSLRTTQLYEAAGNVFWLDALSTEYSSEAIPNPQVTWEKLFQAQRLWTEGVFERSSEQEQFRRFAFPSYFLTAIPTAGVLQNAAAFRNLPLFAGHAILWSWYLALDDAMNENARWKVARLFEAGLTATIRLRLAPSRAQWLSDALQWSETIRIKYSSAVDNMIAFCDKLSCMPGLGLGKGPVPTVAKFHQALQQAKLTYQGNCISKTGATALLAIIPHLGSGAFRISLSLLSESFPKLGDEMTKWMRVCHCVARLHPQRSAEFLSFVVDSLLFALLRRDVEEADVTVPFLVGPTNSTEGFTQTSCVKHSFVQWVSDSVNLALQTSPHQESLKEMHKTILPGFQQPLSVLRLFHKEEVRRSDEAPAPLKADAIKAFCQERLTHEVSQVLATLLYRVHLGWYDEAESLTSTLPSPSSPLATRPATTAAPLFPP